MQEWQEKIEQEVEQLREEVRQLREQRTEEIKTVKVEVGSQDVLDRIDSLEAGQQRLELGQQELKQEMNTVFNTLYNTLQKHHDERKEDLAALKEDFKDLLIKHLRPGGNGH